jgi:hypothetical protein
MRIGIRASAGQNKRLQTTARTMPIAPGAFYKLLFLSYFLPPSLTFSSVVNNTKILLL